MGIYNLSNRHLSNVSDNRIRRYGGKNEIQCILYLFGSNFTLDLSDFRTLGMGRRLDFPVGIS